MQRWETPHYKRSAFIEIAPFLLVYRRSCERTRPKTVKSMHGKWYPTRWATMNVIHSFGLTQHKSVSQSMLMVCFQFGYVITLAPACRHPFLSMVDFFSLSLYLFLASKPKINTTINFFCARGRFHQQSTTINHHKNAILFAWTRKFYDCKLKAYELCFFYLKKRN